MRHTVQLAVVFYLAISLLVGAHTHGKPRTGNWTFWADLVEAAGWALVLWLGGFWRW